MILLDPIDGGRTANATENHPFVPDNTGGLCARLNDKWTVVALWRIAAAEEQQIRFSALKKQIAGVTQRMLTLTLRNLERDGLVLRHVYPEVPPRVEYQVTELGRSMLVALESVNRWMVENMPNVERARRSYDELAGTTACAG